MNQAEVLSVINPQISLTIGNPEIVNMLVQQQLQALKNKIQDLYEKDLELYENLCNGVSEIIKSMNADFVNLYSEKLDDYAKAYSALKGKDLNWFAPWSASGTEARLRAGAICIRRYQGRFDEDSPWGEREEKSLKNSFQVSVSLAENPTEQDLDEWCEDWQTEFDSKDSAIGLWVKDNERHEVELSFKRSEETIALIKKYRAIDNQSIAIRSEIKKLEKLVEDRAEIEKAILARVTQNTLQSNPELIKAVEVLTNGLMQLDTAGLPTLTVE